MQPSGRHFARRVTLAVAIAALLALLLLAAVRVAELLLLVFASLLVAIVLRGLSNALASRTRLSQGLAYALTLLGLLVLAALGAWLLVPSVLEQLSQLEARFPQLQEQLHQELSRYGPGRELLRHLGRTRGLPRELLAQAADVAFLSLDGLVALLFIAFSGLYLGASPGLYVGGLVRLVPVPHRERARQVLASLGHALRWFMLGRLVSMFAVGLLTGLLLHFLGIPLAGLLGLITGLLTFVPYAGPLAAAVPIGLVALLEGPTRALLVLALYTVIQSVEGFLLTPLVQQRAVSLAPALTLFSEFFLGMLLGPLGVILSVPLAAALLVLVRELYVEGLLERPPPPAHPDSG